MRAFLQTRSDIDDFARFLISDDFIKARNPFSIRPLPLGYLTRANKVQDGIRHSIDCMPDIHYGRDTAYHTPRHYYATAAFALALGQFNQLEHDDLDLLVATALVHDFGYRCLIKSETNGTIEEAHIAFAYGLNVVSYLDYPKMLQLNAATRYANRTSISEDVMALCLSDADVMQSCLTPENYIVETALLEREIGHVIKPGFLNSVGPMRSCYRDNGVVHPLEDAAMATKGQIHLTKGCALPA